MSASQPRHLASLMPRIDASRIDWKNDGPETVISAKRPAHGRRVRAKAVGTFVPKLTEKAFAKYGFSAVALISDWPRIAGTALAAHTSPERLKWPRALQKYADVETGCEGRPGATLILRVNPARALDVEYGAAQLIERINSYFGYRAVERLKIIQAPLSREPFTSRPSGLRPPMSTAKSPRPATPDTGQSGRKDIKIKDPSLKAALERLTNSVHSEDAA